ncbi:MAG: glucose-6-phosphate isomerase family protein [Candidatus Jordarchaeum sp.]|uniref:glucose-6-phosphate isomerase family protein n=1 Tax=Candidatus Jordarchaeum sp. TaxID=2823881 RepID=UPI00404B885E
MKNSLKRNNLINLIAISGLPISFDRQTKKLVSDKFELPDPNIRTMGDLIKVARNPNLEINREDIAYWMYRDVALEEHRNLIKKHNIRFDITVMKNFQLGDEYGKTSGHYHPNQYPEIYGVLHGTAIFVSQKGNKEDPLKIEVFTATETSPGELWVSPPLHGHITINRGPETLVMANWVSNRFQSIYGPIETARGAAYYLIKTDKGPEWKPNPEYRSIPPITERVDIDSPIKSPIYTCGIEKIDKLSEFLNLK